MELTTMQSIGFSNASTVLGYQHQIRGKIFAVRGGTQAQICDSIMEDAAKQKKRRSGGDDSDCGTCDISLSYATYLEVEGKLKNKYKKI